MSLYCHRLCEIYPTPNKPVKRLLLELGKEKPEADPETEKLVIELDQRHEYRGLTRHDNLLRHETGIFPDGNFQNEKNPKVTPMYSRPTKFIDNQIMN